MQHSLIRLTKDRLCIRSAFGCGLGNQAEEAHLWVDVVAVQGLSNSEPMFD
jgi:hypothetical protein